MSRPPLVISIQSQVVLGHVGNSAALFPMQAAGLEVAAIPTVVFSNTPDYPTLRGRALPADFFAELLLGAKERGLPERAAYIVSGYIGSPEVAELTAEFIAEAKRLNPGLTYLCDPVMGDAGPGLYVPGSIAEIHRDQLLPLADLATPNPFELSWLTGRELRTLDDLRDARAALRLAEGARLITTGCALADTPAGHIESVILSGPEVTRHPAPHLPIALPGTGDLYAGLLTAALARGRSLPDAVEMAQQLTGRALQRAAELGAGEVVLSDPALRKTLLQLENDSILPNL
ncbi:pyridoxal kinase [Salipiger sp. PrR002]|uniref:pyridoxal kinase n=1 Tax=Salipiger sp. PrR002 TaxID=2706489 RepID=UPI0013BCF958|nr:pyridoxal kinase [Salipiger sp. PrR002]NDV99632.1 pyridoxal kinase [Salipiger sp. PrR002]NDW57278.1 pyridoxal kinase [Salipiger sp. PrR004]